MFWGTPATQFIPWWSFAWERVRSGELPLWNPYLGMGAPLVANYQSAIFYPPNWTYLLLDSIGGTSFMAWGQAFMVAVHLAWAGVGMVLLLRKLGIGELGQAIAGLSYALSGYLVSRAGFLSINSATAWLPWIVLSVTLILDRINSKGVMNGGLSLYLRIKSIFESIGLWPFMWLSLIVGLLLLAGHAQIAWYILLFTTFWTVFYSLKSKKSISLFSALIVITLAILFGTALAAVQLLPTGEYLLESQRSGSVDYASAMSYSFWPWQLLTFLAPDLFGSPVDGDYWGYANYWEGAVYIGLASFILAMLAIITHARSLKYSRVSWNRFVTFLIIVILVSFVLALGWYTPIFPWLYRYIPTFDMFQGPARFSLLAVFSLAILAGIGAGIWRRPTGKILYWTRLGTMGSAAVALTAGVAAIVPGIIGNNIESSLIRSIAMAGVWGIGFGVLTLTAPEISEKESTTISWSLWRWAVCIWVAADLVFAAWGIIPGIDPGFYANEPDTTGTVRSMVVDGRLYLPETAERELKFEKFFRFDTFAAYGVGSNWEELRGSLLPNISLLDRIPSANNFDPLLPGRYTQWISSLSELDEESRKELYSLMSIKVIETIDKYSDHEINYVQLEAAPRISWVPCATVAGNGEAALDLVLKGNLDFSKVVILEGFSGSPDNCSNDDQNVTITTSIDEPNRLSVSILSANPGYLAISDVWYPGWQAKLNGRPVELFRANYLFRGVFIPAGEHDLEIIYQPMWFKLGAILSLTSWLAWGFVALIKLKQNKPAGIAMN